MSYSRCCNSSISPCREVLMNYPKKLRGGTSGDVIPKSLLYYTVASPWYWCHYGSLKTFGFSIISRSPLYRSGSPPGPQRPCARATPASHITPVSRRHNGRRFPTRRAGSVKRLSRGRLSLSPGRRRIVRKCKSPSSSSRTRCTAVVHAAALLCCRCGSVGASCCTVVVVVWWVGRWIGDGWWVLGGWRLDRLPRWRGRVEKITNLLSFLIGPSRLVNQQNSPRVPVYCHTYCCTAVLL